jgi:hypothetical protein
MSSWRLSPWPRRRDHLGIIGDAGGAIVVGGAGQLRRDLAEWFDHCRHDELEIGNVGFVDLGEEAAIGIALVNSTPERVDDLVVAGARGLDLGDDLALIAEGPWTTLTPVFLV